MQFISGIAQVVAYALSFRPGQGLTHYKTYDESLDGVPVAIKEMPEPTN